MNTDYNFVGVSDDRNITHIVGNVHSCGASIHDQNSLFVAYDIPLIVKVKFYLIAAITADDTSVSLLVGSDFVYYVNV
jgi:hypothetical protein